MKESSAVTIQKERQYLSILEATTNLSNLLKIILFTQII